MSDNLPRMDYRQHRRARRLVHECCNYDEGNCLLLDDGEPCVCVQSISFSLMCRWFRVAVLPLDGELAAALLCRGSRKRCAVCGAAFVRQMYEMYADPQVSLHDITKKLTADGMRTYHGRPLSRATLSVILRNPIYVMADLDIYEFFKSQGTDIYNDAADFAGTNGCYYYQGKGNTEDKHKHLQGQTLVLAPSEGFIPSELWLKCRKKLLASHTYQPARKARNTWMAGKIKCGKCGYALMSAHSNGILYMRCTVHADSGACPGCGCVKLHELEAVV